MRACLSVHAFGYATVSRCDYEDSERERRSLARCSLHTSDLPIADRDLASSFFGLRRSRPSTTKPLAL